ncbi:MAG: hypothetical protein N2651_08530 [Fimbriimonadales bacterium]|nr:hypothetical protein [Fimbriimonadales bacterium]
MTCAIAVEEALRCSHGIINRRPLIVRPGTSELHIDAQVPSIPTKGSVEDIAFEIAHSLTNYLIGSHDTVRLVKVVYGLVGIDVSTTIRGRQDCQQRVRVARVTQEVSSSCVVIPIANMVAESIIYDCKTDRMQQFMVSGIRKVRV